MAILSSINAPSTHSSRFAEMRGGDQKLVLNQSLATSMPSDRQTSFGALQVESNRGGSGEYAHWKKSRIFNPKQTSAAVTAENFLKAKVGLEPLFMHNIAATKLALMSIMDKEKPRYSEQVNLLA